MSEEPRGFGRVLTAMVTPFEDDGSLDLDGAANLAGWLVENGSDGLVLCGTTGESPVLSDSEEAALTKTVRKAVDVPILLGTGSNHTAYAVAATRRSKDLGVDGLLVVSPYYNRPSQAGINQYYRSVAASTDLPIVLYDVPARTGRKLGVETAIELLNDVDNIVGLKDAAANPVDTARVVAESPDSTFVYSGDDALTLPFLAVGALGVISVASHWAGRQMGEMVQAFERGEVAEAIRINQGLLASYRFAASEEAPNPVPTKAMLRVLGLPVGECRPPMGPTPDGLESAARELLEKLT